MGKPAKSAVYQILVLPTVSKEHFEEIIIVIIPTPHVGVICSRAPARVTTIFVMSVCLSVCVSVCPEHNSVDFDPILMKLGYVFDINV